jgi:HK97 family phage portal protein
MISHALLWGNGRAYIRRENGIPVELIPLMPDRTGTLMIDGEKWHVTILKKEDKLRALRNSQLTEAEIARQPEDEMIWMSDEEVWHLPGLGYDGIQGFSLIYLARQSWSIGLNAEKHIANQQRKGYSGGLMLEAPAQMFRTEDDAREFLKHFREQHEGSDNTGKIGLLREGIKANVLAMSNTDAQFIEQRRFQREDTALLFCLEGILGDSSNASYASLEQRNLAYRLNCLAPWTTAMEEESDLKLLTERERNNGFYHKFNDGALLRTEKSATMAFISQGIASRVLNPNEGRDLLDLNPYEGGDEYTNPAIDKKVDNGAGGGANTPNEPGQQANAAAIAHISHMIGVESNRVKRGSEVSGNFLEWMDNFYAKWESNFADCLELSGFDRDLATHHCNESKARLLDVCGNSTAENLAENVAKCVISWKNRANTIGVAENV